MPLLQPAPTSMLSDELLLRCHDRAPRYERDRAFFTEDVDELRAAGYLRLPLPVEFGGPGLSLAQVALEQRRLAYYAAPTAEALTMHLGWIGVAADLWRGGDLSLQWVLEEASRGCVFAAGHAEPVNDLPLLASSTRAERVDGGYRFTGHKSLGTLTPVWNYLGLHGLDRSDPLTPRIVHAFMPRNTEGYAVREAGESLGLRASGRDDTLLDGAFVPDRFVARTVPAGAEGIDDFVLAVYAWELLLRANVVVAMARRAMDLTVDAMHRTGTTTRRPSMAHHAGVQRQVAEMGIVLEGIDPHLDLIARQWSRGTRHGARWPMKLFAARHHAVEGSWQVIDRALDLAGAFGVFRRAGLEQLFRDGRLGRMDQGNTLFTHDVVGKSFLGLPLTLDAT
jgi:alkylation response protein AidB-like acyl-CoA dehydrogenase